MKRLRCLVSLLAALTLALTGVISADDGQINNKNMSQTIKVPDFDDETVDTQLPEAEWKSFGDERSQILSWCRSEPVVIGLTVVGGVHLDEGQLGAALDRML